MVCVWWSKALCSKLQYRSTDVKLCFFSINFKPCRLKLDDIENTIYNTGLLKTGSCYKTTLFRGWGFPVHRFREFEQGWKPNLLNFKHCRVFTSKRELKNIAPHRSIFRPTFKLKFTRPYLFQRGYGYAFLPLFWADDFSRGWYDF